jgi:hypothetical protein
VVVAAQAVAAVAVAAQAAQAVAAVAVAAQAAQAVAVRVAVRVAVAPALVVAVPAVPAPHTARQCQRRRRLRGPRHQAPLSVRQSSALSTT